MRRLAVAPALLALALAVPSVSAAPGPQITDVANDANGVNGQSGLVPADSPNNTATPGASQAYADVLSVQWKTVKKGKKVTGFTVAAKLSAPPKAPDGTVVVYRMLGTTALCPFFGVAYYSTPLSDPATPQSAIRDNCNGATSARLTKIANPKISGNTITWTVPMTAIPKDARIGVGSVVTGLYFTVTEIEDFKGQKVPPQSPVFGGQSGLGFGVLDDSKAGDAVYKIGS